MAARWSPWNAARMCHKGQHHAQNITTITMYFHTIQNSSPILCMASGSTKYCHNSQHGFRQYNILHPSHVCFSDNILPPPPVCFQIIQYTTPTSCVFSDNTIYYPHLLCVFRYTTPTSCVFSDNTIYYPHLLCVFRQYTTPTS